MLAIVNDNFDGEISIQELSLDLRTYFPKVAVSAENIAFQKNKNKKSQIPVFYVKKAHLDIDIKKLWNDGVLLVEQIKIDQSELNLIEKDSKWNIATGFQVAEKKESPISESSDNAAIELFLKNIEAKSFKLNIFIEGDSVAQRFRFTDVQGDLKIKNNILSGKVTSNESLQLPILKKYDLEEFESSTMRTNFSLDLLKKELTISSGQLVFEKDTYEIDGSYNYYGPHKFSVNFLEFLNQENKDVSYAKGRLRASLEPTKKQIAINFIANGVDIEKTLEEYRIYDMAKGIVNMELDIDFKGESFGAFIEKSTATMNIYGNNLTLYGMQLDELLQDYKRSQNFNLVDIGAYAFAGPFGAVAVKGSNFTKLLSTKYTSKDSTKIEEIVLDLKLEKGLVHAKDVAFSTESNRLALFGGFDIVKDSILGCEIVVLSDAACPLLSQEFHGYYNNIDMQEVKVVKTLMGSIVNLFNKIIFKKCTPVYFGKVKHPVPENTNAMQKVFK